MFALFWQSLIPFATATMGENDFTRITVTVYAGVLALGALSYTFLVRSLSKLHGEYSTFTKAVNRDRVKGYFTLGVDVLAALIAYIGFPKIAFTFIALTALLWFLPSRIISGNK